MSRPAAQTASNTETIRLGRTYVLVWLPSSKRSEPSSSQRDLDELQPVKLPCRCLGCCCEGGRVVRSRPDGSSTGGPYSTAVDDQHEIDLRCRSVGADGDRLDHVVAGILLADVAAAIGERLHRVVHRRCRLALGDEPRHVAVQGRPKARPVAVVDQLVVRGDLFLDGRCGHRRGRGRAGVRGRGWVGGGGRRPSGRWTSTGSAVTDGVGSTPPSLQGRRT